MNVQDTPIQVDSSAPSVITFDQKANFADDPTTIDYIDANVAPLITEARNARSVLHSEWLEIQRMGFLRHGASQAYKGKSNAYIPAYAKNLDTRVSHVSKGLFPTDDYLSATARGDEFKPYEMQAKAWMQLQLSKRAKLRSRIKPWLRQLHDFGVSVGKVWYQLCPPTAMQGRLKYAKQNPLEALVGVFDGEKDIANEGLRFKTVNMFSWHMWPLTVNTIEEAAIVFEDIQVSRQWAKAMFACGEWKNPEHFEAGTPSETDTLRQESLSIITSLSDTAISAIAGEVGEYREIVEAYVRMPVPNDRYLAGEAPGSDVPVQLILCNGKPLVARRNPFWFQRAPYIVKTLNERADSFYSIGMGRQALDLQALLNDFTNQTNDNGIFGLNPIAKVNPSTMVKPGKIGPGEVWYMTDLNGLAFDRPPVEQLQYGLSLSGQAFNWLNDLLGTPPVLQGTGSKGVAKTATGAQILQNNVKTDIQDVIESIEEECLEPLMDMAFALGQQYQPLEQTILQGGMPVKVTREMWAGDYGFTWNASTQNINSQARAGQAIQLYQMLASTLPVLQQAGLGFNPEPLLRKLVQDGMGFRGFDEMVFPAPQPMMPGMGASPEAGGAPPGAAPYAQQQSAVGQANYGQEGMAPGEGEDISEVRDEADSMAAMMGGMNGQG